MLDYETLLARQQEIKQEFHHWHNKVGPLRQHLALAQSRSHIHPYCGDSLLIAVMSPVGH
jgi:hypothetical protein